MGQSNYTLPVTVPVNSYGESLLGSSPQMAHTSISPRPSSSETDSGNFRINKENKQTNKTKSNQIKGEKRRRKKVRNRKEKRKTRVIA